MVYWSLGIFIKSSSFRTINPGLKKPIVPTGTINNPSGLQNRLQIAKIETTSKVSLKLPSRISEGKARRALDLGHSP